MCKLLLSIFLSLSLIGCGSSNQDSPASHSDLTVIDFDGNKVVLAKPAERIVALAPHIVENVFSVGAGDQLVGVIEYSDFPEAAKQIPRIGNYQKINLEAILKLKPDLILGWDTGNSHTSMARLRELGYTLYLDRPDSLAGIAKSIRDIGVLSGHAELANDKAKEFSDALKQIAQANQKKTKLSSFYQVWNSPLQTISGNHIINHAIELCGGTNIYADEIAVAPVINVESVIERNPDVIIASGVGTSFPEWLDEWQQWPNLTAAKHKNLLFVTADHIQRHTLRLLLGVTSLCEQMDQARARLANTSN